MSLETPTTKEVSDNIISNLESALNQTIPLLFKAFMRVLSKTLGAVFILLYKYGGFTFLQMFVQTATIKDTEILGVTISPLKFWGRLVGIGDPVSATNAELTIDVTVETQTGTLQTGTQLVSALNGVTYLTVAVVALDAAVVSVTVRAASDQNGGGGAGTIGNLDPGSVLSFANPLPNVARNTVVTAQTVTGANEESTDAYRQRIIDKFQKRPQGGAYADYEQWAEETPGIINAYPYTSDCPGQVDVYCEATVESSGDPDGIPTTAQLEAALDLINFNENGQATRRPANALANTFPITRTGFDTTVVGLIVDNLAQTQQDIEDALVEYYLSRAPFIVGLTILPRRDQITNSAVGGIVQDIVSAAGGVFNGVVVEQGGIVINFYTLGIGEKSKSSSVVFT